MHKEKVYLDTSVPSAYYDQRTQERMILTREFWLKINVHEIFISTLVLDELKQIDERDLREILLKCVDGFVVLKVNAEVKSLASAYVKAGILPQKYYNDALHIAVAVVHGIKFLVSWNFKHFVNVKTRHMVNLVNFQKNYGAIEIIAPPEF